MFEVVAYIVLLLMLGMTAGYMLCATLSMRAVRRAYAAKREAQVLAEGRELQAQRLSASAKRWKDFAMAKVCGELNAMLHGEPWEEESSEIAAATPIADGGHVAAGNRADIRQVIGGLPAGAHAKQGAIYAPQDATLMKMGFRRNKARSAHSGTPRLPNAVPPSAAEKEADAGREDAIITGMVKGRGM